MPLLFSYGSLQREDVQVATFGRRLDARNDELLGFELVPASREIPFANVVQGSNPRSRVPGTVFEISDVELAAADEYERRDGYVRVTGRLASGRETWVYLANTR